MKSRIELITTFIFIVCLGLLMGCAGSTEDEWNAQGISSYHIQVTEISLWNIQIYDITVRDEVVVEDLATCQPSLLSFDGTCEVEPYQAKDFTIPGLFALARTYSEGNNAEWATITYNETYSFPETISYNHPDIFDEEVSWRVDTFEVLP